MRKKVARKGLIRKVSGSTRQLRTNKPVVKKIPVTRITQIREPSFPVKVQPIICTCDRRLDTFERFVESYENIGWCMGQPIVFAGYNKSNQCYLSLLKRLNPAIVIDQPSGNFQETMIKEFPRIASQYDLPVLHLEDDIIFSSQFPQALARVIDTMTQDNLDLVTLYGNYDCYWPKTNDFLYKFNGWDYWGNLAFVLSQKVLRWWNSNSNNVWNYQPQTLFPCNPGWDLRIGQYFQNHNLTWHCTKSHFVQHQIGKSAVDGGEKVIQSNLFVS
jgi:hypothetical protein